MRTLFSDAGKPYALSYRKNGGLTPNYTMQLAAHEGYLDIVLLMLAKGATDVEEGLNYATLSGHITIVKLMIAHGAYNFNLGLHNAAHCGFIKIAELMIASGARHFVWPAYYAASWGHREIVELIISKSAPHVVDEALGYAISAGQKDVVRLLQNCKLKFAHSKKN